MLKPGDIVHSALSLLISFVLLNTTNESILRSHTQIASQLVLQHFYIPAILSTIHIEIDQYSPFQRFPLACLPSLSYYALVSQSALFLINCILSRYASEQNRCRMECHISSRLSLHVYCTCLNYVYNYQLAGGNLQFFFVSLTLSHTLYLLFLEFAYVYELYTDAFDLFFSLSFATTFITFIDSLVACSLHFAVVFVVFTFHRTYLVYSYVYMHLYACQANCTSKPSQMAIIPLFHRIASVQFFFK